MVKEYYCCNAKYYLRADENAAMLTCGQFLSQLGNINEDASVVISNRANSTRKYLDPEFERGVQIIKVSEDVVFILSNPIQNLNLYVNTRPYTVGELMTEFIKLKGCESFPVVILDDTSKTADFVYSIEGRLFRDRQRRQDNEIAVIFESTL